jgi:hypothetical protein
MRKFIMALLLLFLSFLILGFNIDSRMSSGTHFIRQAKQDTQTQYLGEKIIYVVKFGKFKLGKAIFSHLRDSAVDGKGASLMTFETKITNFYDLEEIYSDPKSGLPLKIIRNIRSFFGKEKIIELYDQKKFLLTITKHKGKKKEEFKIKKDAVIHNAIMLPFYLRRIPELKIGWSLVAELPNQKFTIKLTAIEKLKIGNNIFEVYRFDSMPKKFEIWVTTDKRRIPVRINGAGVFGYSLIMKEYSPENLSKSSP